VNGLVICLSLRIRRLSSHEIPQSSHYPFHREVQVPSSSIPPRWILSKKVPGPRTAFCLMNSMHHGWGLLSLYASSPLDSLTALRSTPGIALLGCKQVILKREDLIETAAYLTHRQHRLRSTRSRWSARSNTFSAILQVSRLNRSLLSRNTFLQRLTSISDRPQQTTDIAQKMDLRHLVPASNFLHRHRSHFGLLQPGLRPTFPPGNVLIW
jgi:hypothetical protein